MSATDRYLSIDGSVVSLFPFYVRGVVLAYDVKNGPSSPELVGLLREAEKGVAEKADAAGLPAHPRIASWREAYKVLGVKPNDFRPSIEAMARRVVRGQQIPSISALVDIGNVLSLHHLVPAGAHAIDVVTGGLELRRATGDEEFVPFGSTEMEHPDPGEVIFVEGKTVVTRRWSWRQANHTLTLPETTAIELNVDALPPVGRGEVEAICAEAIDLIRRFCGGRLGFRILDRDNPRISLSLPGSA